MGSMLIVTAYHGSGHGDTSTILMVTDNPALALGAVRNIQQSDVWKRFSALDHGVGIVELEVDRTYQRSDFKDNVDRPAMFFRWKNDKGALELETYTDSAMAWVRQSRTLIPWNN